jgi:hypothetical protein
MKIGPGDRAGGGNGGAGGGTGAGRTCTGRRVAQEHGGRRPLATAPGFAPRPGVTPQDYGLVLDQQIVEFAPLHALDQSSDLSPGVDEGGAFRVA